MEEFLALCSKPETIAVGIWAFGFVFGFALSTVITLGDYLCQLILRKKNK